MTTKVLLAQAGNIRLSPELFRRHARQYLDCHLSYKPSAPSSSPVPYALLCRAIELALKAHHLETKDREQVKRKPYGHNLSKLYQDLPQPLKVLTPVEEALLKMASDKYDVTGDKGFDYVSILDVLTAQKSFPKLDDLEALAVRLVGT